MSPTPHLILPEWSTSGPSHSDLLKELRLTLADRETIAALDRRALKVRELVAGLEVETGPFIGTLQLSSLRISVLPKIGLKRLMEMIGYTHSLPPSKMEPRVDLDLARRGLADFLAEAFLREVERLARRGLSAFYRPRQEPLLSPRGRIYMKSAASRAGQLALECRYEEHTTDDPINQSLAEGLRLASKVVLDRSLSFQLLRARDRYLADQSPMALESRVVTRVLNSIDRRTSHYRPALTYLQLLVENCRLEQHHSSGAVLQSSFFLDMNLLFERFLERFFQRTRPPNHSVFTQHSQGQIFRYGLNPHRWRHPVVKPDLLFTRGGRVVAVGDAKYKNRSTQSPGSAELYQLTLYGLAFCRGERRTVYLFHPLEPGRLDQPVRLGFQAPGAPSVGIEVVGVPIDQILKEGDGAWPIWKTVNPT